MSSQEGGIPPGWYQDPLRPDMTRWWDGVQWTERVRIDQPGVESLGPARRVDIDVDGAERHGWRASARISGRAKVAVLLLIVSVIILAWWIFAG